MSNSLSTEEVYSINMDRALNRIRPALESIGIFLHTVDEGHRMLLNGPLHELHKAIEILDNREDNSNCVAIKEKKSVRMQLLVKPSVVDFLKKRAKSEGVSVNEYVNRLVEDEMMKRFNKGMMKCKTVDEVNTYIRQNKSVFLG